MTGIITLYSQIIGFVCDTSADLLGVFGFIILLVAIGLAKGKEKLLTLLCSLFPAALVTEHFPLNAQLQISSTQIPSSIMTLGIFVIFTVLIFLILKNYVHSSYQHHTFWRVVEITALSIAIVGLTVAFLYHLIGFESFYNFGSLLDTLFSSALAYFIWLVLPLLIIPLFVRA